MFLAGVLALFCLPFILCSKVVQNDDFPGKIINRHFPKTPDWKQKPEPTQCSLGYAGKVITPPSGATLVSCEDATRHESLCDQGSCHMGQPDQTPEEKPLSKFLYFTGCVSMKDQAFGKKPAKRYTVYPREYEVVYELRKIVVQGYAAEIEGNLEDNYICTWTDQLEQNFQRVSCNNCTETNWD
ncbi:hypothetical protein PGT21_025924 [Puccinia graminis f. sp. tritici]|uniref:Secreted protein n=1 Tax=Puccinia graminis f. sp. tritici TaxID=56615 RepID=A0A5B0P5L5_PUCGR|nr:hypothetical protein PGT21_025924 [Puccinia graminis f. sp. tritici]KAA1095850.1 hypothetical protein PGTUg99_034006 [Puccinia graminis f. sp. tritici]